MGLLQSEAHQKQTVAAETLQHLLKEAAGVKEAIGNANEQAKVSNSLTVVWHTLCAAPLW